jgi:hypothetical protein
MDEELDSYEMDRVKSEVEWRREQQKADKVFREGFKADQDEETEEKTMLELLEDRYVRKSIANLLVPRQGFACLPVLI